MPSPIRRARSTAQAANGLRRALVAEASHRTFPRTDGTTTVAGPLGRIEVVRDRHGIPHIFATTEHDAAFGHGYVHAQDRLFQMEGARRLGGGRLAEIGGTRLLGSDRFMRRMGLRRAAERDLPTLAPEVSAFIEAYALGVNTGVHDLPALPPEFALLRTDFEPWSVTDSLLVARLLLIGFAGNWNTELVRERLGGALGSDLAASIDPIHPPHGTVTGREYAGVLAERLLQAYRAALGAGLPSGLASNAWAVSGARTGSGRPLLGGDPHVDVSLPGLFHAAHLQGGDLNVIGAGVAGIPGVLMGHNEHLAWSITAGMADVADCYIETFDATDPRRYRTPEGWATADEHIETITVRDGDSHVERVLVTRHGPVVGPALAGEHRSVALRSTALEPGDLLTPFMALWRARGIAEADRALDGWPGTTFNFVMADVDGRIGYRMAGGVPQHEAGEGLLPQQGATSPGPPPTWLPAALPKLLDPADGIVVSSNNAPGSALELGEEWCDPQRAERIRALVEGTPRHDVASFTAIQVDRRSALLERFRNLLLARGAVDGEHARLIEGWDGVLAPESAAAALVTETWRDLARFLAQRIGGPLGTSMIGGGAEGTGLNSAFSYRAQGAIVASAERATAPWFDGTEDRDRQLRGAAMRAAGTLRAHCGGGPERWSLGAIHRLRFAHTLDDVPALGAHFSRGEHPYGGDMNTVSQAMSGAWRRKSRVAVAPGYRQVLDLADWDASVFMLPTGNSGIPGHPRYDDCIGEYLAGKYRPLVFSRAAVEAAAEAILTIEPHGGDEAHR